MKQTQKRTRVFSEVGLTSMAFELKQRARFKWNHAQLERNGIEVGLRKKVKLIKLRRKSSEMTIKFDEFTIIQVGVVGTANWYSKDN